MGKERATNRGQDFLMPLLTCAFVSQGNRISVVSGLSNLPRLEELHLSSQKIPLSERGLRFDLHSMLSISQTLQVLCAVDCGIDDESAASLPPMPQLKKLDLSGNKVNFC